MSNQNYSLEQYIKELKNVFYLTSSLQGSHDITFILDKVLNECIKITCANSGSVMFKHDLSQRLFFYAAQGHEQSIMNSTEMFIGDGIAGTVVREGIPKIINNISLDPKYITINPLIKAEMAIPIKLNNSVQGVIVLDSFQTDNFTDKDLELIQMICTHTGHIIEHYILKKNIDKQKKFISTLLKISHLSSSQEIFHILCKDLNIQSACIINQQNEILFKEGEMVDELYPVPAYFKKQSAENLEINDKKNIPFTRLIIPRSTGDMTFIADIAYTFEDNITQNIEHIDHILQFLSTKDYKFHHDETLSQWAERKMDEEFGKVYDIAIGSVEKELISAALKKNKDNRLKTSHFLGINRNTLRHKIEIYGLEKK